MSRGRFIVIEGLDGSGKSTTAGMLAGHLRADLRTTPSRGLRAVREAVIDGLRSSLVAQQVFYLATVEAEAREIEGVLASGRDVVLDRYLLSTMVYAEQRGEHLRFAELEARLLPAEVTVFLDLPLEVRRARLEVRGQSAADRETLVPAFDAGLREGYRRWGTHRVAGRFEVVELGGDERQEEVLKRVRRVVG